MRCLTGEVSATCRPPNRRTRLAHCTAPEFIVIRVIVEESKKKVAMGIWYFEEINQPHDHADETWPHTGVAWA